MKIESKARQQGKTTKHLFTEKFPGLIDMGIEPNLSPHFGSSLFIGSKDIQEHCLDKQKVKDAVNKHLMVLVDLSVNRSSIYNFLKELELYDV